MEKLINNLNEFGNINRNKEMIDRQDTYIISKKFGFIKWLVDNDKIDENKIKGGDSGYRKRVFKDYETINGEDFLIMWLSTSREPIQDLISLLK